MKGKAPMYIGIFVENQKEAYEQLIQYSISCLKDIYSKYKEPQILNDIQNFQKTFSKTKDAAHITTLFLGKTKIPDLPQKHAVIYQQFTQNQNSKHQLILEGIIYVPGYLIAALTFPKVKCSNQYPHVTLYLGNNAKAVQSNEICEWAFNENQEAYKARKYQPSLFNPKNAPNKFKNIYVAGKQLILPGVYRKA